MTSQTEKAKAKLASLSSSLDDLEAHLEPLFAQTLPETVLGLEPIQQAKLQTVLPYLVYDLIFIYLKSRGIDPKTHAVVPELDRVKQYFDKITNAENPPTKRAEIDKAAAGRFIKHAITQAASKAPAEVPKPESSTSAPVRVPTKITSKMLERQQYENELKEQDQADSEEEELAVFGDDHAGMNMDFSVLTSASKGKRKEILPDPQEPSSQPSSKRRRPAVDPFAGYGDDITTPVAPTEEYRPTESRSNRISPTNTCTPVQTEESKPKRSKKRVRNTVDSPSSTLRPEGVTNIPAYNEGNSSQSSPAPGAVDAKKAKKAKKKARKPLTTSG